MHLVGRLDAPDLRLRSRVPRLEVVHRGMGVNGGGAGHQLGDDLTQLRDVRGSEKVGHHDEPVALIGVPQGVAGHVVSPHARAAARIDGIVAPPSYRPDGLFRNRSGSCIPRRVGPPSGTFGRLPIESGRWPTEASGGNVIEYLARRLVYIVPLLFLVTLVTFSVALLLPGDPALAYIGEANMRDRTMYETMRKELGLDQPIPVQYAKWLGRVL